MMVKPRTPKEWMTIILIGVVVAAALVFPAYVVRTINQETEILLEEMEERAMEASQHSVRVNALTIICVAGIPNEERTVDLLIECINKQLPRDEEITP